MADQLSDIHSWVQSALARGSGSSIVALIKDTVRLAARDIEKNHTFAYMHKVATVTVDVSASEPRVIDLPNSRVKEIRLVRYLDTDNSLANTTLWVKIPRIFPDEVRDNEEAYPEGYWMKGASSIVLDSVPDEDFDLDIHYSEYSDWQKDTDTYTNWLIQNADDLLAYWALVHLGALTANRDLVQVYVGLRDEAQRLALMADDGLQREDREQQIQYIGGV